MGCEGRGNHCAEFDHAAAGQGALAHGTLSKVNIDNALCIMHYGSCKSKPKAPAAILVEPPPRPDGGSSITPSSAPNLRCFTVDDGPVFTSESENPEAKSLERPALPYRRGSASVWHSLLQEVEHSSIESRYNRGTAKCTMHYGFASVP
jgi:hypothetical protein